MGVSEPVVSTQQVGEHREWLWADAIWTAALLGAGRCAGTDGRDWRGGRWTSGKTTERQDGPARFSKQPASGAKWKAGAGVQARVETEGDRGGGDWAAGGPAGVECGIDGHACAHAQGRTPFLCTQATWLSAACALGSRYVAPAQHGRCVPARGERVHRVLAAQHTRSGEVLFLFSRSLSLSTGLPLWTDLFCPLRCTGPTALPPTDRIES